MNKKVFLWFLFFFALAVRIGYSLFLKHNYFFFNNPGEDVQYYKNWAQMIVLGDATMRAPFAGMPLFPYYLAVLYRLTMGHWAMVSFLNLILGSLNCVLLYGLTKKIFSDRTAVLAGLFAATNFLLIYYDWLMMPITLLITLTLIILLSLSGEGPAKFKDWFILGLIVGLATLGDGKFLIFAALLIAYLFWKRYSCSLVQSARPLLALILGLVLILGGVTLRNKIVGGEWIFISSQSGLSLYVGNNSQATGGYEQPEFIRPSHEGQDTDQRLYVEDTLGKKVSAAQVSQFYRQKVFNFIRRQPGEYGKLLREKIRLFLSDSEYIQPIDLLLQRHYKRLLDYNSYVLIMPLAIWGILISLQKREKTQFITLMIFSQFIFSLIYFVTARHRAAVLPLLIIFEAIAINWMIEKIYAKQIKASFVLVWVIVFMFLFPPKFLDAQTYTFLTLSKAGSVYDSKKDFQNASRAYQAALALQPRDSNTIYNLATAYVNLNEYEKAKNLFLQALQISPSNVDILFNLGYVYEKTEDFQNSLNSYQEVLARTPESLDAHYRIANLYQNSGQCDKAKPYYDTIVRLKPILTGEIEKIFSKCENKN